MSAMRQRIKTMRTELYEGLMQRMPAQDFSHVQSQTGMFSYTGLSPQQVERLKTECAVYLIGTGRMCVAALTKANMQYVVESIATIVDE